MERCEESVKRVRKMVEERWLCGGILMWKWKDVWSVGGEVEVKMLSLPISSPPTWKQTGGGGEGGVAAGGFT